MVSEIVQQFFIIKISTIQIYLLWFLLGSFTVATLSDIKHLSAQREFLHVWLFFAFVMFITDLYYHYYLTQNIVYLAAKWFLIFIIIPVYFKRVQKVAWGDILAKMAACSILPPFFVVLFIIIISAIDAITRRMMRVFGVGRAYPFMPAILFTTIILLSIAMYIS